MCYGTSFYKQDGGVFGLFPNGNVGRIRLSCTATNNSGITKFLPNIRTEENCVRALATQCVVQILSRVKHWHIKTCIDTKLCVGAGNQRCFRYVLYQY